MSNKIKISDVFKSLGQPTVTYVEREKRKYEKTLTAGLNTPGLICLVTGPSKTGKTTLYKKVLKDNGLEPLIIRCDNNLGSSEFWKRPLEHIDFKRISEIRSVKKYGVTGGAKIGGTIGWKWLAGLLGEVSVGVTAGMDDASIREKILAQPSPDHLIPVLKKLPLILVVEDFHYLDNNVKINVFQRWKTFADNEVSVIVVGTTHHAIDIADANKDLIGRIVQIDISRWEEDDLKTIISQGFSYLDQKNPVGLTRTIAAESAGLPIITQQTCEQLFIDKGIDELEKGDESVTFTKRDAYRALHNVATTKYKQLEAYYSRLTMGPRKKARKYNTYELVLSSFTLDPLRFALQRHEIGERLNEMPIDEKDKPPAASINSMLTALGRFQKKHGLEIFEWRRNERTLYILEPAFLFYVRWREERAKEWDVFGLFKAFLESRLSIQAKTPTEAGANRNP